MINKIKIDLARLESLAGWQGITSADLFMRHARLWLASIEARQNVIDDDAEYLQTTIGEYLKLFEGPIENNHSRNAARKDEKCR